MRHSLAALTALCLLLATAARAADDVAPASTAAAAAARAAAASGDPAPGATRPDAGKPDKSDDASADTRAQRRERSRAALVEEDDVPPPDGPPPPPPSRRRMRRRVYQPPAPLLPGEARQGVLLSLGFGGASQFASAPGYGRAAASDFDLRFGYGFSDRFQFFVDLDASHGGYGFDQSTNSWMLTLRGQTVLIGDRRGNGLSINGGIGVGGFGFGGGYDCYSCDYGSGYGYGYDRRDQLGLAAGGGISFDARLGRYFAISPELFASWLAVPNRDRTQDIVTQVGIRMNLLWYLK